VLDDDRSGTAARTPADGAPGGAVASLHRAVARLRRELTAYRRLLPDRAVAEAELEALDRHAAAVGETPGRLDTERLRHSLLLVAAALGSVSALTAPLIEVRDAVEELAPPW
jgi:hypothetical protein